MRNWPSIFCILFLTGCLTYFENAVYKPAPSTYQEWTKPGASILDVKRALLECGKPAPDTSFEIYEKAFNISRYDEMSYMNKLQLEDMCMESIGYKYLGLHNPRKICLQEKYSNLPACHINAKIPMPTTSRRLNSWYCQVKSNYEYCLSHALAPKLCNPKQVQNPPPECLPSNQEYDTALPTSPMQNRVTQPYEPIRDYPERSIQLQQQRENNRQMIKLLRDTN